MTTVTKLRAEADSAYYGVFHAANADSWRESIDDVLPRLANDHPAKVRYLEAQAAVLAALAAGYPDHVLAGWQDHVDAA